MASVNQKLGQKIRLLRKAKKISQEELAYKTKTDYSYINQIESGKRNPSVAKVSDIARVLEVDPKDLFDF